MENRQLVGCEARWRPPELCISGTGSMLSWSRIRRRPPRPKLAHTGYFVSFPTNDDFTGQMKTQGSAGSRRWDVHAGQQASPERHTQTRAPSITLATPCTLSMAPPWARPMPAACGAVSVSLRQPPSACELHCTIPVPALHQRDLDNQQRHCCVERTGKSICQNSVLPPNVYFFGFACRRIWLAGRTHVRLCLPGKTPRCQS